jgi:predicted TIM-barrel fold metal-dependent hydrolase
VGAADEAGNAALEIIDGDGHVTETGVADYLAEPYRSAKLSLGVFPAFDHLHQEPVQYPPESGPATADSTLPGPDQWLEFLEYAGIRESVLYPSSGLTIGHIASRDWAIAVARAYNDWLHATYTKEHPSLHGMALLPLQDPEAAVDELRRAVHELGMCGAMLPATGLQRPLGSKEFWPVYAEAARLGCALAVHGGAAGRLGFDHMEIRPAAHALAHPFGVLISLTSMVFNGVFDHNPGLRVGFLEGGVAWLLVALERFDRSYMTHVPYNPRRELLELGEGQTVADYLATLAGDGRLVIGCEGEEAELPRGVELLGSGAFMFSSDFPHEVSAQMCKEELAEIQESSALSGAQKHDILAESARRFYRLS